MKSYIGKCPKCGKLILPLMRKCLGCGSRIEYLTKTDSSHCGNCHRALGSDEYCRYCGTKRGNGKFDPYYNEPQCIYGPPPVRRLHNCNVCGYKWDTNVMIDRQGYCPKCGGSCSIIEEEEE